MFLPTACAVIFSASFSANEPNAILRLVARHEAATFVATTWCPALFETVKRWEAIPPPLKRQIVEELSASLGNSQHSPLRDPADLIIPYRFGTKELEFHGHGYSPGQDLFLAGGRAAWGIKMLTGLKKLPELDGGLRADEWAKRVREIKAMVAEYNEKTAKPPEPKKLVGTTNDGNFTPHPLPAVNAVFLPARLFAPSRDAWQTPKIVLLIEEAQVRELLTTAKWPRAHSLMHEWVAKSHEVRARIVERLLPALRDNTFVDLEGTEALLFPYRVTTGHLAPSPKRIYDVKQDVFLRGGRAAYGILGAMNESHPGLTLDGGLTADEWNKRADAIEKVARRFVDDIKLKK